MMVQRVNFHMQKSSYIALSGGWGVGVGGGGDSDVKHTGMLVVSLRREWEILNSGSHLRLFVVSFTGGWEISDSGSHLWLLNCRLVYGWLGNFGFWVSPRVLRAKLVWFLGLNFRRGQLVWVK